MSTVIARAARGIVSCSMLAAVLGLPVVVSAQDQAPPPESQTELRGFLPEPHFIIRAIDFATRTKGDGGGEKSGFYPRRRSPGPINPTTCTASCR